MIGSDGFRWLQSVPDGPKTFRYVYEFNHKPVNLKMLHEFHYYSMKSIFVECIQLSFNVLNTEGESATGELL